MISITKLKIIFIISIMITVLSIYLYKDWRKNTALQIKYDTQMLIFRFRSVFYELNKYTKKNENYPKPDEKNVLPKIIVDRILQSGKGNPYDIFNDSAVFRYVVLSDGYALISCGPDQEYDFDWIESVNDSQLSISEYESSATIYDPTNGLFSNGDLIFIQKDDMDFFLL